MCLWSRQTDASPSSQPNRGIASVNSCLPGLCHCTFFVYYLPPYLLCPLQLICFPWLDNHKESDELIFHIPLQEPQQLIPRVIYEFSSAEQPNWTQQNLLPQVSSFSLGRQSSDHDKTSLETFDLWPLRPVMTTAPKDTGHDPLGMLTNFPISSSCFLLPSDCSACN